MLLAYHIGMELTPEEKALFALVELGRLRETLKAMTFKPIALANPGSLDEPERNVHDSFGIGKHLDAIEYQIRYYQEIKAKGF